MIYVSYAMKTKIANRKNYGDKRPTSYIKYLVIHFTANDGDSDEGNGNYFQNNIVKASAHYFVDDNSITQSVPDNYVAYSVGGNKYSDCAKTGGGSLYGIAKNINTLNVELCDSKKDGKVMATEKTLQNAVVLCKTLMKKYNIDIDHVIRHFDVNGKHCPSYFINESAWEKFKDRLVDTTKVETKKEKTKKEKTKTSNSIFEVRVDIPDLNIRKGPGTNYSKTGKVTGKGSFIIVDVKSGAGSKTGWGKIKSGIGWISLDYAKRI